MPDSNFEEGEPSIIATTMRIGLNAVIAAVDGTAPKALCASSLFEEQSREAFGDSIDGAPIAALPYGPFDPARHRTFEIGLRQWVERQTQVRLGYVEQLYTFGDKGREAPAALLDGDDQSARVVSVGYLALTRMRENTEDAIDQAHWRSWYDFFPWEDWRSGSAYREPPILSSAILPGLAAWIERAPDTTRAQKRRDRVRLAFGYTGIGWEEERALDRYEIMYEAGLVEEAWRDRAAAGMDLPRADHAVAKVAGAPMASDHRRILATAIGRLRGKLKYRAIIFELTPETFTLLELQQIVEAIVGFALHKQNFRRSVEASGLLEKNGDMREQGAGRPAAVFRLSEQSVSDRAAKGLSIPRLRQSPRFAL